MCVRHMSVSLVTLQVRVLRGGYQLNSLKDYPPPLYGVTWKQRGVTFHLRRAKSLRSGRRRKITPLVPGDLETRGVIFQGIQLMHVTHSEIDADNHSGRYTFRTGCGTQSTIVCHKPKGWNQMRNLEYDHQLWNY